MRTPLLLIAGLLLAAAQSLATASSDAPAWAFAMNPPAAPEAAEAGAAARAGALRAHAGAQPLHVPGSHEHYTQAQIDDLFAVPDWFPDRHPPMPPVVAAGRAPGVMACGYCHLPNGQGRPENAPLAGLPAAYILEQLADLRSGQRFTAGPVGAPLAGMVGIARGLTPQESEAAAQYFSALHYQRWVRVIEASRVPVTRVSGWMHQPVAQGGTEPLGERIIEMPVSATLTNLRDPDSGFIAYVPPGSLRRGERLVRTGADGRTIRCAICHGEDLRGLGGIPPIAGRSPSYLMRQLYDLRHGARHGLGDELMRQPLEHLSDADMLAIVAYVASLPP